MNHSGGQGSTLPNVLSPNSREFLDSIGYLPTLPGQGAYQANKTGKHVGQPMCHTRPWGEAARDSGNGAAPWPGGPREGKEVSNENVIESPCGKPHFALLSNALCGTPVPAKQGPGWSPCRGAASTDAGGRHPTRPRG